MTFPPEHDEALAAGKEEEEDTKLKERRATVLESIQGINHKSGHIRWVKHSSKNIPELSVKQTTTKSSEREKETFAKTVTRAQIFYCDCSAPHSDFQFYPSSSFTQEK